MTPKHFYMWSITLSSAILLKKNVHWISINVFLLSLKWFYLKSLKNSGSNQAVSLEIQCYSE